MRGLILLLLFTGALALCETPTSPCSSAEYFNNPDISSNHINDSLFIRFLAISNTVLGALSLVTLVGFLITMTSTGTAPLSKSPYELVKQSTF